MSRPTTPPPLVSVVIVNWNDARWLPDCLRSLQRTAYPRLEIIVVDNGSTDDSVALLRRDFPDARLIENGENLGFARGNNIGIRACQGRYVALLNADTTVAPDWIAVQVDRLESDPAIGICGSKMLLMREPHKLNSVGMELSRSGLARHVGDGEEDHGQYGESRPVFVVPGAAAFCRRDMLEQIGLFDEEFFAYYEDVDLCWRAWLGGWKCVYEPRAVIHHYRNVSLDQNQSLYWHFRYLAQRNRLWTLGKNAGLSTLCRHAPWLISYEVLMLAKGLKAWLTRARPAVEVRARWDALRGLGSLLAKRAVVQQSRRFPERQIRTLARFAS